MAEPTLEDLSFHEAAHAVVADVLGLRVLEVTVVRSGGRLGHAEFEGLDAAMDRGSPDPLERLQTHAAVAMFAGWAADAIRGAPDEDGASRDFANARKIIAGLGRYRVSVDRVLADRELLERQLRRRSIRLVHRNWDRVELVAAALRERTTLDAETFLRVSRGT